MRNLQRLMILLLMTSAATQCVKKSKKDSTEEPIGNRTTGESGVRLKGVALLYQSLYRTLGPNKEKLPPKNGARTSENIFDTYAGNFGNTDGLRFGEIYPDSPSASYFLALSIMADNAAKVCQEELLGSPSTSPCKCDTMDSAKALLARALPSTNLSDERGTHLTKQFHERCKADYPAAISALLSSLAFAVKN